MAFLPKLRLRAEQALTAKAYAQAKSTAYGVTPAFRPSLILANVFALLILAIPVLIACFGVFVLTIANFSIFGICVAAVMFGLSYLLFPSRPRKPEVVLTHSDIPAFFSSSMTSATN